MSLIIKNGRVITATDDYVADVFIDGETVSAIGKNLPMKADRTIDAAGKLVIPGAIDPHVHMELPFGGTVSSDTFETGTRAAAFGGTTTIIDFAIQYHGKTFEQTLDDWDAKAEGKCAIDYSYHLAVTEYEPKHAPEFRKVVGRGISTFKIFLAYPGVFMIDDTTMFRVMQSAGEAGGMTLVHAENGIAIQQMIEIVRSRDEGNASFGETCTQYLFLDETCYDKPNFEGAKYVFTPPLVGKENIGPLWKGLKLGYLQEVSTDHCPFNFKGQKDLGRGDFRKIPNGGPGVEDRLSLVYDGAMKRGFSLNKWVDICCTASAKMFGMFPKKGTIAVGSDADIVIFDPDIERTISAKTHHMNCDYSLFEGWKIKGKPETVLSRGKVIVENDKYVGKSGEGKFIKRGRCATA